MMTSTTICLEMIWLKNTEASGYKVINYNPYFLQEVVSFNLQKRSGLCIQIRLKDMEWPKAILRVS